VYFQEAAVESLALSLNPYYKRCHRFEYRAEGKRREDEKVRATEIVVKNLVRPSWGPASYSQQSVNTSGRLGNC
jgi:hypothetical protein